MSSQKADTDGGKSPHLQEIMNESDDPAQRSSLNNSSPVEPDHQPQCTGNIESCQPQENNVSSQQQVLADQDNNNDIGDYSRGGSFHLSMCSSDTSGDDLSNSSGPNTQKTTNDSFDITGIPSRMGQDFSTEEEYPFEDEKARMIANLMKNHGNFVSASLVERSNLIQSVGWLSRHVPGCVLKFLIDSVHRAREEKRQCSERNDDLVFKRGMDYNFDESDASDIALESFEELNDVTPNAPQIHHIDNTLPIAKTHQCALLFVDMSGFTKISTMLDVESLSDAINSYFEMIVNAITSHGGDILKFAGDAIFAEWKVSEEPNSKQNLEYCVSTAANCGATIVSTCSNYPIFAKQRGNSVVSKRKTVSSLNSSFSHPESDISEKQPVLRRFNRRGSMHKQASMASLIVATLNVKCGVGMGQIVGMHVGDNISRREYLILGDPIDQVANAEGAATLGEVFSSPEATACLAKVCDVEGDWKSNVAAGQPTRIAVHKERFFQFRKKSAEFDPIPNSDESGNILRWCEELDFTELQWLKKTMSLYVHPVVVNDDDENTLHKRETDQERHQAEAELRNVYVMFIMPLIEPKLTGDNEKDQKLFKLLNDIMNVTTRELDRLQGHLRQFIVDDKGVVLIGTFGLRGSTFPNMIAQRAIPVTLAIHEALQEELGVKNRVGGTFGRV